MTKPSTHSLLADRPLAKGLLVVGLVVITFVAYRLTRPPDAESLARLTVLRIRDGKIADVCQTTAPYERPWPCGDPRAEQRLGQWVRHSFEGYRHGSSPVVSRASGGLYVSADLVMVDEAGRQAEILATVKDLPSGPLVDSPLATAVNSALTARTSLRAGELWPDALSRTIRGVRTEVESLGLMGMPTLEGKTIPWDEELEKMAVRSVILRARRNGPRNR